MKSANCAFSLEWVAQRYKPQVVVVRREPLNVVSSWTALNIGGDRSLARPGPVRERWLRPFGLPELPAGASDFLCRVWTVAVLTVALKVTAERHPEWTVVSHDELCEAPVEGFAALFQRLGLAWTEEAEAYLRATDDPNFVVTGANPLRHPNQVTNTAEGQSRREQQSTQFRRRLSEAEIADARVLFSEFPLGTWGAAAG